MCCVCIYVIQLMFHLSLLIMSPKIVRFIIITSIIIFVFSIIYWLLGTHKHFNFKTSNSNSNSNLDDSNLDDNNLDDNNLLVARCIKQKQLSYIDALYFTIGTHTTVGFGDITARSECTRSLVIIQLIILILQLACANL